MRWYSTVQQLTVQQRDKALRFMNYDGLCSHAMMMLVTGAFLPGMAVALNAGNLVIGLLGSLAPISQMAQIPGILLVEKIGLRKLVTVVFAVLSRVSLVLAAIVPFINVNYQAQLFFAFMLVFFFYWGLSRDVLGILGSKILFPVRLWEVIFRNACHAPLNSVWCSP